jgi:dienelactone hydrolase
MTNRAFVLSKVPQAKYKNLNGCHCIDNLSNNRFLSYAAKSREGAWKEAAEYLKKESNDVK